MGPTVFAKNYTHTDGTLKEVLGGTQIIDRFWRTLRRSLVGRAFPVGSHSFHRRIRSTQWEYWHRGEDQWTATGDLLRANRLADGAKIQLDVVKVCALEPVAILIICFWLPRRKPVDIPLCTLRRTMFAGEMCCHVLFHHVCCLHYSREQFNL